MSTILTDRERLRMMFFPGRTNISALSQEVKISRKTLSNWREEPSRMSAEGFAKLAEAHNLTDKQVRLALGMLARGQK